MIKSMTAFAANERFDSPVKVRIETRSYNSRYLDVSLKITQGYQFVEENIKRLIADRIARGRIEVVIWIENKVEDLYRYEINMPKANAFFKALNNLSDTFNLGGVNINTLMGVGDIIRPVETDKNQDQVWSVLRNSLDLVMSDMDKMKIEEGKNIADDFYKRLDYIEKTLECIESRTSNCIKFYKDKLKERIEKLTDGLIELDNDRIIHEASVLAIKSDISEEIVRSCSHIKQFRSIMDDGVPAGKKLNFLIQEFNREFNTIASKASSTEISHMIVSLKSELEKIREQIQNVE